MNEWVTFLNEMRGLVSERPGPASLVYGWTEAEDDSLARNRELFALGEIGLHDFEERVEMILRRK